MNTDRRRMLQTTGRYGLLGALVASGLVTEREARAQQAAWNKAAFETKDLASTARALGGDLPGQSNQITLNAPDIAEDGAEVRLSVSTTLPNVTMIAVLVAKNPNMLAAAFTLSPESEPFVATHIKMAESSDVFALVRSDGKFHVVRKDVRVTLGGCGA